MANDTTFAVRLREAEAARKTQVPLNTTVRRDRFMADDPACTLAEADNAARNEAAQDTLEQYDAVQLDKISRALAGDLEHDDWTQLVEDCAAQLRTLITLADYDEDLVFAEYEDIYSECHKAYKHGKKSADTVARIRDELAEVERGDSGDEITSYEVERQQKRLAGHMKRATYWRARYKAASIVLREVVDHAPDSLQRFMSRTFTPDDKKPKPLDRRSARAQAAIHGRARDRFRQAHSHTPQHDGIDAA